MTAVILREVERYEGTAKGSGKPYTKFTLKDGNGQVIGATFDSNLGATAEGLEGERVLVETKPARDPKFAPEVTSIEPAPEEKDEPVGEGMSKAEWQAKDMAIHRMACIKAAADSLKHTVKSEPSREDITNFASHVLHLANIFYLDVSRARGIGGSPEDDIPFGPEPV